MLNIRLIENLMRKKRITKASLCADTGIARPTLDALLHGSDVRISTLEKLAKALNVPVCSFFDDFAQDASVNVGTMGRNSVAVNNGGSVVMNDPLSSPQLSHLQTLLAQKDERIDELKERIVELKERIAELKQSH